MKLDAIETSYDGFRFRSRLEARWAVFFDTAEIEFHYEPQGFKIPESVVTGWSAAIVNYLPDFFLPDLNLWVECKASWTPKEKAKTFNAAAHFSAQGTDLLVCPEVFRQPRGGARLPWRLHLDGDELLATPWPDDVVSVDPEPVASRTNPFVFSDALDLLRGHKTDDTLAPEWYRKAARAAQSARFEYGETPVRP